MRDKEQRGGCTLSHVTRDPERLDRLAGTAGKTRLSLNRSDHHRDHLQDGGGRGSF